MILLLFDIDGTLIFTGGAGMRAFSRALHEVFDIRIDGSDVRPDGKTDPLILREILASFDLSGRCRPGTRQEMFALYIRYLEQEMEKARESGRIAILPGVEDFLPAVSSESDFALGLATGNLEDGARVKLEKAGLYGYFKFGGFGSDSEDRTELTRIGIERGMRYVRPDSVDGVFVVGDTPLDVIHGRNAGASVIAVASGRYGVRELQVCAPDLVLSDLREAESIISFMRNGRGSISCNKW
ncbi:MAG: HAD hydrolase-like protein [Acidobacteria bacterium]|nr:HAD hydrolase-like protein [Acidobacteriota bacterium]